jgi:ribosomal protein S14
MANLKKAEAPVNQGRHEAQCSICKHAQREEIEQEFLTWKSPDKIGETFGVCRDSIYRHARAFDLLEPRRRNVRYALERIIERAGDVEVNANAVVSAVATYSKLNANGQWIDRRESVNLNEMFARMTEDELRRYASRGELPGWFTSLVGATEADSQRGGNEQ